jgi:hypothetical protein
MKPNRPMREGEVREGESKQGVSVDADDVSTVSILAHCHLNTTVVSAVLGMICSATKRI